MKNKIVLLALFAMTAGLWAQAVRDTAGGESGQIPLRRIVILTSGLAYYEHSGAINGPVNISLPFRVDAVNDALKSLVVNDPSSANPSVSYQSENTLFQTLRSLKIDLSDSPELAAILSRLKGAEIEIDSPTPLSGRIAGIEYRPLASGAFQVSTEPWLLLNTDQGMKLFNLKEISSIKFKDPAINQDLNRALDLIEASGNSFSRELLLSLPGSGSRRVSLSYVIPSPVWKVSYRLDLGAKEPLFQGWAIVDNDSDTDWKNVELSLVAGRPSSFIQNLYPPYYVRRPVLPLSIAGTAEAATHDQGSVSKNSVAGAEGRMYSMEEARDYDYMAPQAASRARAETAAVTGGAIETAAGSAAGGQFEFTIKNPVTLDRRMSAMLPLVESAIQARGVIIYNGSGKHPRLGAEITNTSGMKLPAGPITVYDGGVYAGDALIEFWNEDEKRLISFGEDLSVTTSVSDTSTRAVSSVNISGGVMTINRSLTFFKTYTFKNAGSDSKRLILEHNKTAQTSLVSPEADEQTANAYRFTMTLHGNRELSISVSEQRPISESVRLLAIQPNVFLSYTTDQEIPANVRTALQRAVELKRTADNADVAVRELEAKKSRLSEDQDRIRRNLEAAGNQTQQGQEYLRRLVSLDGEIDALAPQLDKARADAKTAREAWENYLNALKL